MERTFSDAGRCVDNPIQIHTRSLLPERVHIEAWHLPAARGGSDYLDRVAAQMDRAQAELIVAAFGEGER